MVRALLNDIREAASAGLRGVGVALQHPFLLILKWLSGLAAAWILLQPIAAMLHQDLDQTVFQTITREGITRDLYREWLYHHAEALAALRPLANMLVLGFIGLHLFVSGGVLRALWSGRMGVGAFFQACLDRFPGMILISVLTVCLFGLMVSLPLYLAALAVQYLADAGAGLGTCFYLWWGSVAFVVVFPVSWVARVYIYARLWLCAPKDHVLGGTYAISCFLNALAFCARRHIATFIILAGFFLLHPLVLMVFGPTAMGDPAQGPFTIALALGQLAVLGRVFISLAAQGAHLSFLRAYADGLQKTQPAPETTPQKEPAASVVWDSGSEASDDEEVLDKSHAVDWDGSGGGDDVPIGDIAEHHAPHDRSDSDATDNDATDPPRPHKDPT